jgi:hypothetical protein
MIVQLLSEAYPEFASISPSKGVLYSIKSSNCCIVIRYFEGAYYVRQNALNQEHNKELAIKDIKKAISLLGMVGELEIVP